MSRYAATFFQKLKMSMFTSTGTVKGFSVGNIDSLSAKSWRMELTKEGANKVCLGIACCTLLLGALMIHSYTKKLEEILSQQQKRVDSIHKLSHLVSVKLQHIESKANQSDKPI